MVPTSLPPPLRSKCLAFSRRVLAIERASTQPRGQSCARMASRGCGPRPAGREPRPGTTPATAARTKLPLPGAAAAAASPAARAAFLGEAAGGDAGANAAMDLGWLSAEQLAEMGLTRREDVVKSTSMVSGIQRGWDERVVLPSLPWCKGQVCRRAWEGAGEGEHRVGLQ